MKVHQMEIEWALHEPAHHFPLKSTNIYIYIFIYEKLTCHEVMFSTVFIIYVLCLYCCTQIVH